MLSFLFVHANPVDLYSLDSWESNPVDLYSLDSWESNWNDAASDDFFWNSPDLDAFSSDDTSDPPDQDYTMDSWDFASLPGCGSQGSVTDDFLQARDNPSCPALKETEGNLNLPTGLFQDPLQFLDNGLKTPPVGQNNQHDLGSKDGDLNFGAFMRNRPASVIHYPDDERICPPDRYGLSNTPVCHYPNRGSSPSAGEAGGFTLYDVTICRCLVFGFSDDSSTGTQLLILHEWRHTRNRMLGAVATVVLPRDYEPSRSCLGPWIWTSSLGAFLISFHLGFWSILG